MSWSYFQVKHQPTKCAKLVANDIYNLTAITE